jgi:hypothetical protein
MNNYERAVIEAARALVDLHRTMKIPYNSSQAIILDKAVDALDEYRKAGPDLTELAEHIRVRNVRAYKVFERERRNYWTQVRTARDFAALAPADLIDTRGAGPYIWGVWRDALDDLGITPSWAQVIGS